MNCEEVAAILEVSDPARAPRLPRLQDHLRSCAQCREEYPELVWLLEARDADRPIRVPAFANPRETSRFKVRWVAAAAILLTAAWFGWRAVTGTERRPENHPSTVRPPRPAAVAVRGHLSGDLGTVSYRTVTIDRGHRQESLTMADVLPLSRPASTSGERRPH